MGVGYKQLQLPSMRQLGARLHIVTRVRDGHEGEQEEEDDDDDELADDAIPKQIGIVSETEIKGGHRVTSVRGLYMAYAGAR